MYNRQTLKRPLSVRLAMLTGKSMPRERGLKFASFLGKTFGSIKASPMVKAIRANQWVIHEGSLTKKELNQLPKLIFASAARCFFDYLHYLHRPELLHEIIEISPKAQSAFDRIRNNEPSVFVCPHLSNFELIGYMLATYKIDVQVLSYPNPKGTYKLQNHLRKNVGISVTPMSLSAFRMARDRLRQGGSILTGLDRPLDSAHTNKYKPTFFGHEANLPLAYIRMAKEANAPVIIIAPTSQPDGRYCLEGSDLIWMRPEENLENEILNNGNRVLKIAEGYIKNYATQWAMFYPVWPQFLGI